MRLRELGTLFAMFLRVGLFTVGGGYAMLPMLRRELVEQRGWISDEELLNVFAVGQSTPGIIAMNTATFIGYRRRGLAGAIASTAGMVAPSLIIITVIAAFFRHFKDIELVQRMFAGIRVAVAMLLVFTVADLLKKGIKDVWGAMLCVAAFVAVALGGLSPVWMVLSAGLLGVGYYGWRDRRR